MALVDDRYAHAGASSVQSSAGKQSGKLPTSGGVTDQDDQRDASNPFFFPGALTEPRVTALGLTVLSRVVARRRVELVGVGQRCTRRWHTKRLASRGPCKHILAVQLATGEEQWQSD